MKELIFLEQLVETIKEEESKNSDASFILTKILLLLLNRVQYLRIMEQQDR